MTTDDLNETVGTIMLSEHLPHFAGRIVEIRSVFTEVIENNPEGALIIFRQVEPKGHWPHKCLRLTQDELSEMPNLRRLVEGSQYKLLDKAPFFWRLA